MAVSRASPLTSLMQNGSFASLSGQPDSFLDKHTARNIAKSYGNVVEKFKLTGKLTKVASDDATSTDEAFQVFCNSCAVLCFH